MAESITDGTGQGYNAKVDSTNRLSTRAITEDLLVEAVKNGDGYAVTSGVKVLTSSNQSTMLYFKNNESVDFVLTRAICTPFRTTGGTENFVTFQCRFGASGITGGSGSAGPQININLGSANQLDFDNESGQEGATLDGTTSVGFTFVAEFGKTFFSDIFLRIPPGQSLALLITPPSGNTSCTVVAAVNGYLDRSN